MIEKRRSENIFTNDVEVPIQPRIDPDGNESKLVPEWILVTARDLEKIPTASTSKTQAPTNIVKFERPPTEGAQASATVGSFSTRLETYRDEAA